MAILKDLIVHGPSHFIGKVFINDSHIMKINGSNVPENPKFTDTVSSASTTGDGNAITGVSVDNGSFTFTKGSTFLTSQNTAALFAGTSSGTGNVATTNGNTYLILQDGTNYSRRKIIGTDLTKVTSDANGNISISTKFDNQQANKFFGGPKSGSAAPSFREIELEDLPHDTTIIEGSNSQNLPTTQAVAAYVGDKIDNLQIGYDQIDDPNNLIIDGENPVLDPVSARPRIKGDENSYVRFPAGIPSVVSHGVRITSTEAVRPFIRFGSDVIEEGTLCGLTPGSTYTFSCKLRFKLLSGGDTSTRYFRIYFMTNKADPTKFASEAQINIQSLSTILQGVELSSKATFTFTVPLEATKVYLQIICNQATASHYAAGDYIEATEFRLEEGSAATSWGNKSDLKIGGRNYFALCNSVKGYLYPDGTIHSEDTYKEYTCDYIPVSKGEVFTLSTKTLNQDDQPYLAYRFFDSEKNPFGLRTAGYVKCINNIEVPDGAAYIRASYRTHNGTATCKLELGSIPTDWTPAPEDLMEEIDTAKGIANTALQNVEEIETIASTALKEGPEFILGTHVSNSSSWTGESRDSALFQGKTINYQLPYTGISGVPTFLRLLLANGNTTGDIALVDNTGNTISDQYPAGSILSLVYDTEGVSNPPVWRVQDTTRKIEEDQISISATNDTIPTSLAVKNTIDKLPIIGRNLLRRTGGFSPSDFVLTRSTVQTSEILRLTPTSSAAYAKFRINYLDYADFENKMFTVSLDVRKADISSNYTTANNLIVYVGVSLSTRLANLFDSGSDRYGSKTFTGITSQWQRVSFTFTVPNSFTTGKTAALVAGNYFTIQVAESGSRSPIEIRHVKLEEGAWATDWTRAPEDFSLGYVTPQMFGAKGDGVTDDTDAIQAALNTSLNVFLPSGVYIISYPLFIRSGTHFYGASSGATTIKAKVDVTNGTAFSISNMPHSSGFSNIDIQLENLTQDQINTCRYLFVQEPEIGTYMLIVAESIRSQYANETGSLKRPGFTAGNTSSFLIENFTLDCNHTRANYPVSNVGVGVGGLRLIRPYDRCSVKNVFVNNCTCRAIYVGDAVSPSYIQSNYTAWMNFENLIPSEEPDEQPEDLVKMVRRRTRSQTLAIDNCQFMGSKTGSKFTPDTYLYTYWRPNTYYPYTWQKLTDIYDFTIQDYNKITSATVTFNGSNGTTAITPNSAGTAAGLSGYYVHNKIAVGTNVWLSNQTDYLAYFYNSFQLNLKDTKIMYSSANFKIYPCVVFNNCTDLYVRGCSFAHTLGEGIRLTGGTKYFRLIANTYENLGVIKTNSGQPTGNGFRAGGLHNMFKTKEDFSSTSSLFTDRDYVIYCDGEPATDTTKRAPIVGGIIIETTYNNTPRDVYLQHTNDMFIIGTFKQLKASVDDVNTVVIGNLTGAIETNKFSTENLFKSYSVTTSSASSVGGWTYLGSTALSAPQGMVPIGVVVLSTSDTRPATAYISGGNLYVRSTSNGASFTVRVTFAKP